MKKKFENFLKQLGDSPKRKGIFQLTLGIYEVFLERSGRKIWVKPELRAEPYIPCYTPRRLKGGERSVA